MRIQVHVVYVFISVSIRILFPLLMVLWLGWYDVCSVLVFYLESQNGKDVDSWANGRESSCALIFTPNTPVWRTKTLDQDGKCSTYCNPFNEWKKFGVKGGTLSTCNCHDRVLKSTGKVTQLCVVDNDCRWYIRVSPWVKKPQSYWEQEVGDLSYSSLLLFVIEVEWTRWRRILNSFSKSFEWNDYCIRYVGGSLLVLRQTMLSIPFMTGSSALFSCRRQECRRGGVKDDCLRRRHTGSRTVHESPSDLGRGKGCSRRSRS